MSVELRYFCYSDRVGILSYHILLQYVGQSSCLCVCLSFCHDVAKCCSSAKHNFNVTYTPSNFEVDENLHRA